MGNRSRDLGIVRTFDLTAYLDSSGTTFVPSLDAEFERDVSPDNSAAMVGV